MGKIKNVLKMASIIALSLAPIKEAKASVSGNVRYIHSEINQNSYVQSNQFYKLPQKIRGFAFLDFSKSNGYYGKTSLEKEIYKGINLKNQTIHCNEPLTQTGLGISAKPISKIPLKLSYLPIWIDKQGKKVDKNILGYYFALDIPLGLSLSGFGEWDVSNNPKWTYGEIELKREIKKRVSLSYNPALKSDGDASPKLENRISLAINF